MLDIIEKLSESITPEQEERLREVLGDDYREFESLLSAKSKSRIDDQIEKVKAIFKRVSLPKLFKLHGEMTPEQRDMLNQLL